ncbi:uncharacterized protein BXZ73DRAFT_39517, partial [Epithele typhae]|uniref:uncharacterized protein n=1 Tax=Epithele typhae TaxID=378194 RepID=UPI00200781C8
LDATVPDELLNTGFSYAAAVFHASDIPTERREEIWNLWETNMRTLTEPSSFGWDPDEKKEELFHADARYILLCSGEQGTLVAFTTFRFDFDEDVPQLYCYELQVSPNYRRCGLGQWLVEKVKVITKHYRMQQILLTVLKGNTRAYLQ